MSSQNKTDTSSAAVEKPIKSPCVSVCVLNDDDICVGCFRSGNEISHWGSYDNGERREVLLRCHERAKLLNPFMN